MSGTISGGRKAAQTNIKQYGEDFYAKIGQIGGRKSKNCGFASDVVGKDGLTGKQRASIAGKKGGEKSRRRAHNNID